MDFSDKVNSSSTPSRLSASPMFSKSDENDQNYLPSVANLNPRKLREVEKIANKKVLTERNEALDLNFSENPLSEIANVDPKSSSCQIGSGSLGNSMSQTTSPSSRVSDIDRNEENSLVADLSSRPYDPLTNYLSPRPKFLRYKPSRRREIFLRQQNDRVEEGNCGIGDSLDFLTTVGQNSLSVTPTSSSEEEETGKQKEKLEESEGEFSEVDEELEDEGEKDEDRARGWTVKELLKFLLITASLVFSTSYITSMNPPTPSFEVSGAFRCGFCSILNHTGEFGSNLVMETRSANERNFWNEEVTETASRRISEGGSQFIHQEDTKNIGLMEETEILNGENEGKTEDGLPKLEYQEQVEVATEKPQAGGTIVEEMADGDKNEVEFSEVTVEDVGDQEGTAPSEIPEKDEFIETSKPTILNAFDQDNLVSEILVASGNEYSPQMEGVEMVEAGDRKMVESDKGEAESFVREASKITMLERITNSISSFGGITYLKDLEKLKSEFMELILTESLLKVVLGLSVSSAILTCLVLSFQFKQKNDEKEPVISVSVKPLLQSPVAEAEKIITRESKSPSINPTCDINSSNCEPIGNVDSFKMLSSSIHARNEVENFKELYHHVAPTVQFLSEFVVGEISSSLKNKSGLKNRMVEAENSSFSVSVEEKPVSKIYSGPTNTNEQALSKSSTMSSPYYGSLTTKKKIVKKEVEGDKEVKLITTPVRRSTRIRNRIVSP